ncbi:MAG: hypothetical protein QOE90_807 [Thermoplasmata archaeon]|jgi:hypothetical protein|nr:hypothetical protein [Thermoplasmata archaeon]
MMPEEYGGIVALVDAARAVLREPRLLPFLVVPASPEAIPCSMPAGYKSLRGCGAKAGEPCLRASTCPQRVECFRQIATIRTRPELAFACPACRAVVGQYCVRALWPETFDPSHDHTHPSRRRLGDAVRAVLGGPPLHAKPAYDEWVRGDRWREEWTRRLGEAYYVLHYDAGTRAEKERARIIVNAHEALPMTSFFRGPASVEAPAKAAVVASPLVMTSIAAEAPVEKPAPEAKGPRQARLEF